MRTSAHGDLVHNTVILTEVVLHADAKAHAAPQPAPTARRHSPSPAPATALRESMLLAGRRVPLSDLSSARQGV